MLTRPDEFLLVITELEFFVVKGEHPYVSWTLSFVVSSIRSTTVYKSIFRRFQTVKICREISATCQNPIFGEIVAYNQPDVRIVESVYK